MFLATTALTEFWDREDEILFLGTWCLRHDRRSDWEGLRYQVMPLPWEDRQRLHSATDYLRECYERTLERLSEYFNDVYDTSRSQRYYRILLGPWLMLYIHVLYDKYVLLTEALEQHESLRTVLMAPEGYWTPRSVKEFTEVVREDPYNFQLCSQVMELLGCDFPRRALQGSLLPGVSPDIHQGAIRPLTMARRLKRWVLKNSLQIAQPRVDVGNLWGGPTRQATLALAWRSNLRVLPLHPIGLPDSSTAIFDAKRRGLSGIQASDTFEKVLAGSLPVNFPRLYLEGYAEASQNASQSLERGRPRAVLSATIAYSQDAERYMLAEAAEQGSKVIAAQHGGSYGMDRYQLFEEHERACADTYYVWGWAEEGEPEVRSMPGAKLSTLLPRQARRGGLKRGNRRGILMVITGQPRYNLGFWSGPATSQWEEYRGWEARFAASLSQTLRQELTVRPPPNRPSYVAHVREVLSSSVPDLRLDSWESYGQSLKEYRVVVVDHPVTTFLEALVSGTPTVLFWEPKLWEMRDSVEPYLDTLRRAGILWHSPEEAARKVATIYEDPGSWWLSQEVREAVDRFTHKYALASSKWASTWADALKEEVRGRV